MSSRKKICLLAGAAVFYLVAVLHYSGYYYFHKYQAAREKAESIENAFPKLETDLKKAIRFFGHPAFFREIGRLYLEMALAENSFGTAEKRDSYLNLAVEALSGAARKNPLDAAAVFDLGRAFLLYNDPVPVYQDKARRFFRRALEIEPADEFINTHVLFLFLAQWDSLDQDEKTFVRTRLAGASSDNPAFIDIIRKMWKKNYGDLRRLEGIL